MTLLRDRTFLILNLAVSALAVLFLVWLVYLRQTSPALSDELSFLPALNALLNGMSATALLFALYFIRTDRPVLHRNAMLSALLFSGLFLVSYVVYHFVHGDTKFTAEGGVRMVYFFILASHIILSVAVLPLIIAAFFFALTDRKATHKKVVRFTYPIWLYVSVTGVLIFVMIRLFN